jgi:hypothetical protein
MRRTLLLTLLLLIACESDHPARPTVDRFVEAMQYGDVDGMLALHVDGTSSSDWCREEFRTALAKARDSVDREECRRIRSLGADDLEAMDDELRLAVQVAGWVCENPEGTCEQYAETVFRQTIEGHPLVLAPPKKISVRRVFGDEARAAAYIDLTDASGTTRHRTLELQKYGDQWRIAGGLLNEPETKTSR